MSLHEERLALRYRAIHLLFISIHAPIRGATKHSHARVPAHIYFNPRLCKRSDIYTLITVALCDNFNPRPYYKRSDIVSESSLVASNSFQSTLLSMMRSDTLNGIVSSIKILFQSTPSIRGAT